MVFLLDVSGSMRGAPMEASKAYMRHTLKNLRPKDSFRIVEFNNDTGAMSEKPLRATEANIQKALAYVGRLRGSGGTELVPGLERALGPETADDRIRIATVLSDGYVGNEYEVVETVRREIGDTRLTVLGIGSGTNRFALEEMAELGRGFTRYIDPTSREGRGDSIRKTAQEVAEKLETPVLTDLSVDWGELSPKQTTPQRTPDLFAGESVRIMGRYDEPGTYEIVVSGRAAGEKVDLPLEVELPGEPTDGRSVELTWARSRVEDFMHQLTTPQKLRRNSLSDEDLQRLVTQLGLDHDIATKWTSFVAVSENVVNPDAEEAVDAAVPEPQVADVSSAGYDRASSRANGAPEPSTLISLLMSLLACFGWVGARWWARCETE
jgi:Ca-activated chloride channel family protein